MGGEARAFWKLVSDSIGKTLSLAGDTLEGLDSRRHRQGKGEREKEGSYSGGRRNTEYKSQLDR